MKSRLAAIAIVLAAGAALWLLDSRKSEPVADIVPDTLPTPSLTRTTSDVVAPAPVEFVKPEIAPDAIAAAHWTETSSRTKPNRPNLAITADLPSGPEVASGLAPVTVLENMRAVFRQYSSRFGGNPIGVNREITAALNGKNPQQVVFIDQEDGMRLNSRGELIDNWGTPYFFHQLSATKMEIRSAGQDKRMWTSDDLVTE